ncbi:hypothetical protein TARUN_7825 [Trichoderma arundinaceum]|uniref:F-box domain-containing protein n=1 Tax=Trichoderma arundinaceum TaxID=490622 RepID=A0A395NE89_TRIAR|nr:hypothetical protein TARUN_7825 [Trichoderma arundinaceum]
MPFLGTPFSIDRLLGLHLFDNAIGLAGQKLPPNQAASEARKRPAAASASTTSSSASSFYNFSTSPSSHSLSSALSLLGLIAQNPVPSPSVPAAASSPELPIATWPMAQLPVEIFEIITRYLTRAEVKALRLVCREFEAKVSAQYFRNVVVPFRAELYTNLDHDENSALASRLFTNGMRIFESFGPHILRFALSLELDEFTLAYPPVKPAQEAIPAFWGIYRWPHETYHRYTDLEGLEQTADETDGMKKALRCLTKVTNLGLCCDAGLGFLVGPDQAVRKINNRDPVFDARDWRQDARSKKHDDDLVTVSDFNGVPRDLTGATAQHDNFKRRVLEKMISDAGFAGYYVHEAIELLLKTEGVSITTIDFDEREAIADDEMALHQIPDSRLTRRGQRLLNHHHVNHHQQQQHQQHLHQHQQLQLLQLQQQQPLQQLPQEELQEELQEQLQEEPQEELQEELQEEPQGELLLLEEPQEEPNQEQQHHTQLFDADIPQVHFPPNPNAPPHPHLLQHPQPHLLQPHLQHIPMAWPQHPQHDLHDLLPEQFQFNALHNLPPNMPIHLLPPQVQQQLQQQLPPGFPLHLQPQLQFPPPPQLHHQPDHRQAGNRRADNRRADGRQSEPSTTIETNRQPLIPTNLTRAQKELLLELEWAHRAMIQSYVISIIDNAGDGCFSNLTNITIAKIPSAHVHILCRTELWERIPSVKNVSLAVIADWRKISKPSPGVVEDIHVSPVEAVSKVYRLLNDYIGRQPNIENLRFEWICGGEFAPGPYQRNQFVLPAPIVESPDLMASPGGAKDTDKLLDLPFVKQFSLKNCWAAPNFLFQTIRSMALRSLDKLEFESVSFSGPPSFSPPAAHNNAGLVAEDALPLAAIIPGMAGGPGQGPMFQPVPVPLLMVPEEPSPERLVMPDFLSWSGFCEHFSPGIKIRSLPLFRESPASEAFTKTEDLSPFLPDADRLRADEAQYGLSSITLRSCGYVFVDIRSLDIRQILPAEGQAAHVYVNTYRHDIFHSMQCCRDKFLGRILPYMPITEARSLELIWQMEQGWSKVYSEQVCDDAIADGFDLPGMGRFSGIIEKLDDADVPMMTE